MILPLSAVLRPSLGNEQQKKSGFALQSDDPVQWARPETTDFKPLILKY
jgi:hypothetical protein